jgi:hypothetical protein
MAKARRPFIEDGSEFGISRTDFRRAPKTRKRELMIEWFGQNFENPAERTPYESAEGGYQWIWGGPYDAREQLSDMFGKMVPESLIEDVVEELEDDGITDWAPTPSPDDYDQNEPEPEPPPLNIYLDERTGQYGTRADHEARERVRAGLAQLRAVIDQPRPAGIGHNNPPEKITEANEPSKLQPFVLQLQIEFAKPEPSISLVKKLATPLRDALVASIKWAGRKVDKIFDAAATTTGAAIAVAVGSQYIDPLRKAFDTIISWLDLIAKTVF